jgi:peptide/nickel transport system permease protein
MKKGKYSALKWSRRILWCWLALALLAPLLANDRALIRHDKNGWGFPFLNKKKYSETASFELSAPIPYHAHSLDLKNANGLGPFETQNISEWQQRHWLGTDQLGRDVTANLLHGARTALLIGAGAMALSALLGILLGILAAYYGDQRLRFQARNLYAFFFAFPVSLTCFIALFPPAAEQLSSGTYLLFFAALLLLFLFLFFTSRHLLQSRTKQLNFPLDLVIGRVIEVFESIPTLFLIIVLASFLRPSITTVILIIALSGWTNVAKYMRAEILKIRELNFIESGYSLGLPTSRLIFKHLLPNALPPVLTTLAFGVAAAILIESTLSFLGLGIAPTEASWGKLLAAARGDYRAWWLAVFPGLALFLSVFSCNQLGDHFSKLNE